MTILAEIVQAVSALTDGLTNLVGAVEKNIRSAGRIADYRKERQILKVLEEVLISLTQWHLMNRRTLWRIGELASGGEDLSINLYEMGQIEREGYEGDFSRFLFQVYGTSLLVKEYSKELIRVDHRLFENIHVGLHMRRVFLNRMITNLPVLSKDELKQLYDAYRDLVINIEQCKDEIQSILGSIRTAEQ